MVFTILSCGCRVCLMPFPFPHVLISRPFDAPHRQVAQLLRAAGASLSIGCVTVDDTGEEYSFIPLALACFIGSYEWAEWLMAEGSNPNLAWRGIDDDLGHPMNSFRALCCLTSLETVLFGSAVQSWLDY